MLSTRWLAPLALAALLPLHPGAGAAQGCDPATREALLREVQDSILKWYDVPNPLAVLAPQWIPAHFVVSNYGYGMAMAPASAAVDMPENPNPFEPLLLMYRPRNNSDGLDHIPDPPYELVGWGYGGAFDPAHKPDMGCAIVAEEFFIHEAGYHTPDGGFVATPPAEATPGSVVAERPLPPTTVGVWHPRVWDVHVWVNRGGTPVVEPCLGLEIPGLSLAAAGFFFQGTGEAVGCTAPGGSARARRASR
ncbi:MAG TPA: hypothetical protein VFX98_15375 [Longimicrobiaceae bacterium]|nr:hypothetical protein [Longimicrobiaceae bacterium]